MSYTTTLKTESTKACHSFKDNPTSCMSREFGRKYCEKLEFHPTLPKVRKLSEEEVQKVAEILVFTDDEE
jgi:hypothetical protein